jgi:hypothetical protein
MQPTKERFAHLNPESRLRSASDVRTSFVSYVGHVCVGVGAAHEGLAPRAAVAGPGAATRMHASFTDDVGHVCVGVGATPQWHSQLPAEDRLFAAPRVLTTLRHRRIEKEDSEI